MPAVRSFALYAALAVLMDFALQMTAFVALLSLDARRQDKNRCELFCCVSVSAKHSNKPNEGFLLPLMRKYYAPALLNRYTRIFVVNLLNFERKYFLLKNIRSYVYHLDILWNNSTLGFVDGGVHPNVLRVHIPHVACESGSGPGACYADSKYETVDLWFIKLIWAIPTNKYLF